MILLYDVLFIQRTLWKPSHVLSFFFFPLYSTLQTSHPAFLLPGLELSVVTRTLLFYYKLEELFLNTFSSVRNIIVWQLFCHLEI